MDRKAHIIGGIVTWAIGLIVAYFLIDLDIKNTAMWIMLTLFVAQFGAQLPDYDVLTKKFLPHRNVVTHSIFLPAVFVIPIYFVTDATNMLLPIYAFFLFGFASHLILDLHVKGWVGSACIHIFWKNREGSKSMSGTKSFLFLLFNGIILIGAGIVIMYFFNVWV